MLNYLVNRNISITRVSALFVDLRVAFDTADRGILIKGNEEERD